MAPKLPPAPTREIIELPNTSRLGNPSPSSHVPIQGTERLDTERVKGRPFILRSPYPCLPCSSWHAPRRQQGRLSTQSRRRPSRTTRSPSVMLPISGADCPIWQFTPSWALALCNPTQPFPIPFFASSFSQASSWSIMGQERGTYCYVGVTSDMSFKQADVARFFFHHIVAPQAAHMPTTFPSTGIPARSPRFCLTSQLLLDHPCSPSRPVQSGPRPGW